jgi:hypothetical protein
MLVLAGTLLGLLAACSAAFFVLGSSALVDRRWKDGALRVAAAVASVPVVLSLLAWSARLLIPGDVWTDGAGPEVGARALAENISGLMNISVFGPPLGLIAGTALVWCRRGRKGAR